MVDSVRKSRVKSGFLLPDAGCDLPGTALGLLAGPSPPPPPLSHSQAFLGGGDQTSQEGFSVEKHEQGGGRRVEEASGVGFKECLT